LKHSVFLALVILGVMAPEVVVINNSAVDIYWFKPTSPNGLITNYQVYRSSGGPQSLLVHSGPPHVYTTIDASVDPGVQYRYLLEAVNSGGAANSSRVTVTLPPATPDFIPAITNFTALWSDSIYAEWDPLPDNSGVDQLRVLVGAGDSPGLGSEWPVAATARNLVVGGLSSFTRYSARLAACLRSVPNGCGTGPVSDRVRTLESPPADQLPPFLTSIPDKSRGDDKLVKRCLKDDAVPSISPVHPSICRLQPNHLALHTKQRLLVVWRMADQLPPFLTSTGPTTVVVSWETPQRVNGAVLRYRIRRRDCISSGCSQSDSGILVSIVDGSVRSFVNSGLDLQPFSVYEYSITAVNSQGETSSNWTAIRTAEAPPKGTGNVFNRLTGAACTSPVEKNCPTSVPVVTTKNFPSRSSFYNLIL